MISESSPVIDPQQYALGHQPSSSDGNTYHHNSTNNSYPQEGLYHSEPLYCDPPEYPSVLESRSNNRRPPAHQQYSDSDMGAPHYRDTYLDRSYDASNYGQQAPQRGPYPVSYADSLPRTPRSDRSGTENSGSTASHSSGIGQPHLGAQQQSSNKQRRNRRRRAQQREMQAEVSSNG